MSMHEMELTRLIVIVACGTMAVAVSVIEVRRERHRRRIETLETNYNALAGQMAELRRALEIRR